MDQLVFNNNVESAFPYLVIDNWFDEQELNLVWKELEFLNSSNQMNRAEKESSTAKDQIGNPMAAAKRANLDEIYNIKRADYSNILRLKDKLRQPSFFENVKNTFPEGTFQRFTNIDRIDSMISYYENYDFYKTHNDISYLTILIWLYKEPKKFDGGELELNESSNIIDCKNNRLIMFRGDNFHTVNPVIMKSEDTNKMNGRFTLTYFLDNY